jgi:hypothetical protein
MLSRQMKRSRDAFVQRVNTKYCLLDQPKILQLLVNNITKRARGTLLLVAAAP